LQDFQEGLDPTDYYSGQPTDLNMLWIVSGNNQVGAIGSALAAPLVVAVLDSNGKPLANAPVTLTVSTGLLLASPTGTGAASLSVRTDSNGYAQVYFQFTGTGPETAGISVSTQTNATASTVAFNESSSATPPPPNGNPTPNPVPVNNPAAGQQANIQAVENPDGSFDITWNNAVAGTQNIQIMLEDADGTPYLGATVPNTATSVHIPPQTQ